MARIKNSPQPLPRPDVYRYHDYRAFLRDWLAYLRKTLPYFSLRSLSSQAGLGSGHLPMVISGRRELSRDIFLKLSPFLKLKRQEVRYLTNLVEFGGAGQLQLKVQALDGMKRSFTYQRQHPDEVQFSEYMSRWLHVVIREMSRLEGFRAEPRWIRKRLRWKTPLSQISSALEFLLEKGFLKKDPDGRVIPARDTLSCQDEVFSTALKDYHRQMFELATHAMGTTPAEKRELHGYTFAIHSEQYASARKIIEKALQDLESLEKAPGLPRDSIYHMQLALFPMTKDKP